MLFKLSFDSLIFWYALQGVVVVAMWIGYKENISKLTLSKFFENLELLKL